MSTAAIAAQVRDAHAAGTACRIVGGGTWLDAGHPVRDARMRLDVQGAARGITEYVPGDLTLTARAGTTLAELHEATRANRQRVALDPYGTDDGTLGATIATSSAGPSAAAFGTPRDQVLGLTFVTGTGDVVTAGGRVVKNVAGFDLVRLCTGAWGTLGVITEATLRLRALSEADETLAIAVDVDDDAAVHAAVAGLRSLPFSYEAAELLDAQAASALGFRHMRSGAVLLRAGGSRDVVRAMRAAVAPIGVPNEVDPEVWPRLRAHAPAGSATLRLSHAPSRVGAVWNAARALALATGGSASMSVGRTVARVTVPPRAPRSADASAVTAGPAAAASEEPLLAALHHALAAFDGMVSGERLPAGVWRAAALHRARADARVHAKLTRGVRDAFDPARVLNPGILGLAGGDA